MIIVVINTRGNTWYRRTRYFWPRSLPCSDLRYPFLRATVASRIPRGKAVNAQYFYLIPWSPWIAFLPTPRPPHLHRIPHTVSGPTPILKPSAAQLLPRLIICVSVTLRISPGHVVNGTTRHTREHMIQTRQRLLFRT